MLNYDVQGAVNNQKWGSFFGSCVGFRPGPQVNRGEQKSQSDDSMTKDAPKDHEGDREEIKVVFHLVPCQFTCPGHLCLDEKPV